MRYLIPILAALLLVCLIYITAPPGIAPSEAAIVDDCVKTVPFAVCFAEGTDEAYVAEWTRRMTERVRGLDYNLSGRWSNTAHGGTGSQGDGATLTYSFVPDGLNIEGDESQLFSALNAQFGTPEAWQAVFAEVFNRWGELTGNTYEMVSDDGAGWSNNSPGVIGSRGDIRIASTVIDGGSGVLAYNFFPNRGEMVLDAAEDWSNPTLNYRFMRNIVAHEHGHGLGLEHVCPIASTKLLEPFYTSAFDGPQHDEILAGQRGYGDPYEPNDTPENSHDLGAISGVRAVEIASLDDNSDNDWWRFTVIPGRSLTITIEPDGHIYLEGNQNNDGSCQAGTTYNTLDNQDLNFSLYSGPDTALLVSVNDFGIGNTEQLFRFDVPANVSNLKLNIWGAENNEIQLYRMTIESVDPATPFLLGCPLTIDTTLQGVPNIGALVLTNPVQGNQLTVSSITVTGPFTVSPANSFVLEPSDEAPILITYDGQELGTQTGIVTVNHNGPGGPLTCEVSGTTITSSLVLFTGPVSNFGNVPINTTDSVLVGLRSEGNVPLIINSITATAPFSSNFTGPVSLNPGPLLRIYPRAIPTQLGENHGWLIINHSAPSSPDSIELIVTGTPNLSSPDIALMPKEFALYQNYPNPFNPTTTISFDLPQAAPVSISLYNLNGQLVREIIGNQAYTPGHHEIEIDATNLATGVYIYHMEAANFHSDRKLLLLK